jgi:hypothetical protein
MDCGEESIGFELIYWPSPKTKKARFCRALGVLIGALADGCDRSLESVATTQVCAIRCQLLVEAEFLQAALSCAVGAHYKHLTPFLDRFLNCVLYS